MHGHRYISRMSSVLSMLRLIVYFILLWRRRRWFWVVERRDWASGCAAIRDRKRLSSTAQTVADDTAWPVPSHCAVLLTIFRTIVQLFVDYLCGKLCSRRTITFVLPNKAVSTSVITIRVGNLYVDCCLSAVEC